MNRSLLLIALAVLVMSAMLVDAAPWKKSTRGRSMTKQKLMPSMINPFGKWGSNSMDSDEMEKMSLKDKWMKKMKESSKSESESESESESKEKSSESDSESEEDEGQQREREFFDMIRQACSGDAAATGSWADVCAFYRANIEARESTESTESSEESESSESTESSEEGESSESAESSEESESSESTESSEEGDSPEATLEPELPEPTRQA